MTDIILIFEVHQPFRIRRNFFWEHKFFRKTDNKKLFEHYFDINFDRDIFKRISEKCYLPANNILLDLIDKFKHEKRKVKVSFSLSGTFLEQCELFNKDVLESFKQLAETGCVEFLGQTYYHSLCSLYPSMDEFIEQVKMHKQAIKDLLNFEPKIFENTELLYNNRIAKTVETLNFKGIYAEGVEKLLKGLSPNYVYAAAGCKNLKVLLRNCRLTDDISFRFSMRSWDQWPLTADKYASWLASTPGQCISIFPDYETFGEHHWPETGIHDFLRFLPIEILKWNHLAMATPSEVLAKHKPKGFIDFEDFKGGVSWADLEKDISGWLSNSMQWAYYTTIKNLSKLVEESQNLLFKKIWRLFQVSDHLYYMFTAGGSAGEVHSYFNPYGSPFDAYITCQIAVLDFEAKLRSYTFAADEPFRFYVDVGDENFTGIEVLSLKGFIQALLKVNVKSLEFHVKRGDFEKWAEFSLHDSFLAEKFKLISKRKLRGEKLRLKLLRICLKRLKELSKNFQ